MARRRVPGIFIATRTRVVSKQAGLMEIGADHVTVDEVAAAEAMLHAVMERIGVNTGGAHRRTEPGSTPSTISEA